MIVVRDPILQPISITDLRPTQMTVGMRAVSYTHLTLPTIYSV